MIFCFSSKQVEGTTCHAIALEGGGSRGAYEAGVLRGLVEALPGSEVAWDVATGISAGSINTFVLALFKVGDEQALTKFMVEVATNLTETSIFKHWGIGWKEGLAQGLLHEKGLVNTSPLRKTLENVYDMKGPIKNRKFAIGATSMTTGNLHIWNETISGQLLVNASMASSAIPGVFPYQTFGGDSYQDGGVIQSVNVISAVTRCLEVVSNQQDITVDIVLTAKAALKSEDLDGLKTIGSALRTAEISRYNTAVRQIREAQQAFPSVQWRYLVEPTQPLPGSLDFSHEALTEMVNVGIDDGKNIIKKGPMGQI
eukprot:CAMPEP_0201552708 /NCGR_PEP_ID=MMETSP0173_2-20130828/16965_1 /ASSEMBLY_ACC=CAM_ASM_000268 /TAXON_ID=218659 /ORGANISM="Vexillifera sp., Strain DIVA3 564/2" /LENGTH=312 /DNA_ID=CAMNT_0047963231 /DNA_START=46 /DNA_END=984 /DNA_ORIENTATION=+